MGGVWDAMREREKESWNDTGNDRGKVKSYMHNYSIFPRCSAAIQAVSKLESRVWPVTILRRANFVNFVWLELEWPEELFWVIERYRKEYWQNGYNFFFIHGDDVSGLCESEARSYMYCSFRVESFDSWERDWLFWVYPGRYRCLDPVRLSKILECCKNVMKYLMERGVEYRYSQIVFSTLVSD